MLDYSTGNLGKELLEYLGNKTSYNTDMIWQHVLHTENMADIRSCLNLCYILPKTEIPVKSHGSKVALIMHEHYPSLVDYCFRYSKSFGDNVDIIITCGLEEIRQQIEKKYHERENVHTIIGENSGRDIRSLLNRSKSLS